jgi:NAD(P)-dependent dehydrogenase (short-subunit alcohol dehydrogenase family)
MNLANAVVLVTGANRGIGLAFAQAALARGARKVYAASRDPGKVTLAGVEAIRLDVTNQAEVDAAAARCGDVTLLVNNAGIAQLGGVLGDDPVASLQAQFDVNVMGILRMGRAFAPVLERNGGGAMLNVLSIASWVNRPMLGLYGTTKSAAWGLTNSLRHELRPQRTQVVGLHVGFVDTDLTRGIDQPKSTAAEVVGRAFDALEAGQEEVLADERTQQVKRSLGADASAYLAPA